MDKNQISWNEKIAQQIIQNLEKRGMDGSYAAREGDPGSRNE
jgi:hypothetical protein